MLNSKGEIADFLDVSQFVPAHSAYECVAYSAALIYYCGPPNQGPSGSTLQASNLAQYYYGLEEGSNLSSNMNGMSLQAEYDMLQKMGLHYQALQPNINAIKSALADGLPVMLCGAETGMYDVGLGERIPYSWTPSGNHCIVVSGADMYNLLVHDCASIGSTGVRPGPRVYDAAKLEIVSATAVTPRWKENIVINIQQVAGWFVENDAHHWTCKQTGKVIQYAILDAYKSYGNADLCGLSFLGLPRSNEIPIEHLGPKYAHLAGKGIVVQVFERGDLVYDPGHLLDSAPGISGAVYPAHIYDGVGADLLAAQGGTPAQPTGIDPTKVKDRLTAIGLASHNSDVAIQSLVNQAI